MTKRPSTPPPALAERIGARAARKLKGRRRPPAGAWYGLSMMGMVGWSVSVPSMVGAALGAWIDRHYPGIHAWTLTLMVAGMILGCFNAWRWVDQEDRAMHRSATDDGTEDSEHD